MTAHNHPKNDPCMAFCPDPTPVHDHKPYDRCAVPCPAFHYDGARHNSQLKSVEPVIRKHQKLDPEERPGSAERRETRRQDPDFGKKNKKHRQLVRYMTSDMNEADLRDVLLRLLDTVPQQLSDAVSVVWEQNVEPRQLRTRESRLAAVENSGNPRCVECGQGCTVKECLYDEVTVDDANGTVCHKRCKQNELSQHANRGSRLQGQGYDFE